MPHKNKSKRLHRTKEDKMIAGVAGGIARYFGTDATFVRILFVIGGLFSHGSAVLLYIILALVMPKGNEEERPVFSDEKKEELYDDADTGAHVADRVRAHHMSAGAAFGIFIIAIGILILLSQFISFAFIPFRLIFAIAFLLLGIYLLLKRM